MSSRRAVISVAACTLALAVAGCNSGGGLFNRPDASVERVVGTAMPGLVAVAELETGPALTVLDHLDSPAMLERLPGPIRDHFPSGLEARPAEQLSAAARGSIERAIPGRTVLFVPIQGAPRAPDDPWCAAPENARTRIELGMFLLLGGHGDAYLVVVEAGNECGAARGWASATLGWEPGGPAGGEWVVREFSDDGRSGG